MEEIIFEKRLNEDELTALLRNIAFRGLYDENGKPLHPYANAKFSLVAVHPPKYPTSFPQLMHNLQPQPLFTAQPTIYKTQTEMLASAASALQLSQTYALNGSGLDVNTVISGGYGSAHDLARLAGALVAHSPEVADATTRSTATAVSEGGTSFTVKNTDPLTDTLPRLLLSKTGFTDLAGGNLALVFDVGIGHPVAVVVLGSSVKERFTDGAALVFATLAHFAGVASL